MRPKSHCEWQIWASHHLSHLRMRCLWSERTGRGRLVSLGWYQQDARARKQGWPELTRGGGC